MTDTSISKEIVPKKIPWNKSRFTGPKPPLKAKQVWSIRTRLQLAKRMRDLALFRSGHRQQTPGLRSRTPENC
jgi:hypothetical protein